MPAANATANAPQQDQELELRQLCFHYPGRPLFTDLQLRIGTGLTLVRGDDGSGKTTLLRLLSGQLRPQSGSITLGGLSPDCADPNWARQVAYADTSNTNATSGGSDKNADPNALSVPEWLRMQQDRYPTFNRSLWLALLEPLGLQAHLEKQLFMLSTGSKRKLLLAAAAASGARLTLLEQPFAALDQRSAQVVHQLLEDAAAQRNRIWLLADYVAPPDITLSQTIDLDPRSPH